MTTQKRQARQRAAKPMPLRCGDLRFWLRDGAITKVEYAGVEVLRGISFLVRDENWGTCAATIGKVKATRNRGGMTITFNGSAQNGRANLAFSATISATARQLQFHVTAKPDRNFHTNRTGFVVLHPAQVAGRPLKVTHTDGSTEQARFPKLISPGQPFFEIRALEHKPAPGLKALVLMEGNKFEMEDQRNWSDASFKTYVCSLLDPWPYVLKAGQAFEQKITVTLRGQPRAQKSSAKPSARRVPPLPEIGIAIPPHEIKNSLRHIEALMHLSPRHITGTLHGGNMAATCRGYAMLAQKSGIPLTLEIVLPALQKAAAEVAEIAGAAAYAGLQPQRVVITQAHDLKSFQPTDRRPWGPSFEEMAAAARKHFPNAEIGGGMISYFTELNRKRPPQGVFDFITHAICPIVHDASDEAVMQTLESLPHIFTTAKSLIGNTPYHLGPSTIGARLNPYGAKLAHNPNNLRMCLAPNDPRQFTRFAVNWNRHLIEAASHAGLKCLTLSALTGPQGLLDNNGRPSPLYTYLAKTLRQR
jgi:hypothetical protein